MNKTAIVTGGTSGIGKAAALALKNDGWTVYELSRRLTGTEGINHITADITDESGVAAAVEQVVSAEGHIDLVVNNAGFGISGAVEFTDTEDAKRLFDTDFFGMVRINRLIIPIMRTYTHSLSDLLQRRKGRRKFLHNGAGKRGSAI